MATTLIEEIEEPHGIAGTRVCAAFTAGDDPVNVSIREPRTQFDGSEQGLAGKEPYRRGNPGQFGQSLVGPTLVFDRRAYPDIVRPSGIPWGEPYCKVWSLGEQQPVQVRRLVDEAPETPTPGLQATLPLENIGHGGAENSGPSTVSGALSFQRRGCCQ